MTRRQVLAAGATVLSGHPDAGSGRWSKEWKIVDTSTGKTVRWHDLPGQMASADVVFVGEQHDDPETHQVELALLHALYEKRGNGLTLAMEMFERDNQSVLNDYLAGKITEDAFGKSSRLWKNYTTDYRPLIEFAREKHVPVIASNAPQSIVRRVGKEGIASLNAATAEERPTFARFVNAPDNDEYFRRFSGVINEGHGDGKPMDADMVRRFYEAQCLRDDTMAESIVNALSDGRTILHINGSFHSDAGYGTAARVLWRRPLGTKLCLIKVVPTKSTVAWEPLKGEANYLILVPDKRPVNTDGKS